MVVFTCNNCGDSLQKPKVAKHYQFGCRNSFVNLTCVDCHKDFRGDEYVKHTKCITEDERYGAKGFTPKPSSNKGERKQQEWINVVQNLLNSSTTLTAAERNVLNTLRKHENIPRKKAKFLNFIHNIFGHKVNMNIIESLWIKMEDLFKESKLDNQSQSANQSDSQNRKEEDNLTEGTIENQNNENMKKESNFAEQNENLKDHNITNNIENSQQNKKKRKLKKRAVEVTDTQENDPVLQKKFRNDLKETADGSTLQEDVGSSKFLWKSTIKEIISIKEEISLKKLRKKVIARYLEHCSSNIDSEKASFKFEKKLEKVDGINIIDGKVRIASVC